MDQILVTIELFHFVKYRESSGKGPLYNIPFNEIVRWVRLVVLKSNVCLEGYNRTNMDII